MKRGRIGLAVLLGAVLGAGCSGVRRESPQPSAARPLSAAAVRASASSSVPAAPAGPPLGLEAFEPWLAQAELRAAADALEAGDEARAARLVEAIVGKRPLAGNDIQSFQLLLARLREAAGDLAGAAASYELAAAAQGPLGGYAALGASRTLVASGRAP